MKLQQHIAAFIDPNTNDTYFVTADDKIRLKNITRARVFATKQGARQFIGRRRGRAAYYANRKTIYGGNDMYLELFGEDRLGLTTNFNPLSEHFCAIPITITPIFSRITSSSY